MSAKVKIGLYGIGGRMGRRIAALLVMDNNPAKLAGAIDAPGAPLVGHDVGEMLGRSPLGIIISDDIEKVAKHVDVFVDFSTPEASLELASLASRHKRPTVVGTTGFSSTQQKELYKASQKIPLLVAPNMSLGVNLLSQLVRNAARALPPAFQVEVLEIHHNQKQDAPSGTALMLARAAAEGRGIDLKKHQRTTREGMIGKRPEQEIGLQSIRGGDVVGEHCVYFLGTGEQVQLTHRATTRDTFAAGAIRAAVWLVNQSPGLYNMLDVLGLKGS